MFQKKGFVDYGLIKIKDKLAEATAEKAPKPKELKSDLPDTQVEVKLPHAVTISNTEAESSKNDTISSGLKNKSVIDMRKEVAASLKARIEEFRLLKRDICEKLTEKLSYFPEDIKITERRLEELKNAIEKFASLVDELKSIDENSWNEDTPHSEIGRACHKAEHARLEYIRINARLSALQRESTAAEMDTSPAKSLIMEISSMSWKQGFKIGFLIFLPVILAIFLAALILALGYIIALKI